MTSKNYYFYPSLLQFMRRLILALLLLINFISFGQDTIYLDSSKKPVDKAEATYYRIESRVNSGEIDLLRKTYFLDGQIESERRFKEKGEKLISQGLQKHWYENGQLFYEESYKNGERHGEFLAFWKDGSKRRHDVYKRGKLKSGKVWDENGQEQEHFPVFSRASFPGGQEAMMAYLKKNLPVPSTQEENTEVRVIVSFMVNKEGSITKIDVHEGAPHWYNAVTVNTLAQMPKWNPGKFLGDPVNIYFTLPVTFRK
jgi:hypothetical protein